MREVQRSLLMQLREMRKKDWRSVGASTARFVQAEHLQPACYREEEYRRCEEHADEIVRETCGFKCGRRCHLAVAFPRFEELSRSSAGRERIPDPNVP